jgi:hypothetical protein
MDYQQSALHWNIMHFERDFERIYRRSIEAYQRIAAKTNVQMHTTTSHLEALNRFMTDSAFDQGSFRRVTLAESLNAARREINSTHVQEYLMDGDKGYIALSNFLGGEYHLTIDEVFTEDGTLVLQESKNTGTDKLPKAGDIKDGLLKLILYANIDRLFGDDDRPLSFRVQLKLTGRLQGRLRLPADDSSIDTFCSHNQLSITQRHMLKKLHQEVAYNQAEYGRQLSVLITGNP